MAHEQRRVAILSHPFSDVVTHNKLQTRRSVILVDSRRRTNAQCVFEDRGNDQDLSSHWLIAVDSILIYSGMSVLNKQK